MDKTILLARLFMVGQVLAVVSCLIILLKRARLKARDLPQTDTIAQEKLSVLEDKLKKVEINYAALEDESKQLKEESLKLKANLTDAEARLKTGKEKHQVLEKENKELTNTLQSLQSQIEIKHSSPLKEVTYQTRSQLRIIRNQKKGKIGEILVSNNFITKDILDKALKYKEEFGVNITQYLLSYGYVNERQLAQCLCTQFAIPYLPLGSYKIPEEIIKLVPMDIAEKYWLIPVEKTKELITIVMADPLDTKAIQIVEQVTGCQVQPFVGILSEIMEALEVYYKIIIPDKGIRDKATAPFFINTETYTGPERREAVRFRAEIEVYFPVAGTYKKSITKDVSRIGFLLEADRPLDIGALLPLQLNLPREYSPLPIAAIVQVIRVDPSEDKKFAIGLKIIKISKEEINAILKYAATHEETNIT